MTIGFIIPDYSGLIRGICEIVINWVWEPNLFSTLTYRLFLLNC